MIKRAQVTAIYQINMYCDLCGKRMERANDVVLCTSPPQFVYKCKCGHIEYSTKSYPCQEVFFDEEKAEECEGKP